MGYCLEIILFRSTCFLSPVCFSSLSTLTRSYVIDLNKSPHKRFGYIVVPGWHPTTLWARPLDQVLRLEISKQNVFCDVDIGEVSPFKWLQDLFYGNPTNFRYPWGSLVQYKSACFVKPAARIQMNLTMDDRLIADNSAQLLQDGTAKYDVNLANQPVSLRRKSGESCRRGHWVSASRWKYSSEIWVIAHSFEDEGAWAE